MTALAPMELTGLEPAATPARVDVSVDHATGSLAVSIPIPVSPARDGLHPQLTLTHGGYDPLSAFPHGWSLSGLPFVEASSAEGLPRYDATDRYLFAGQELVPLDEPDRLAGWAEGDHEVRVFRPRLELAPMRVERWTHTTTGRVHWRARSGDGATMTLGRRPDGESRIEDPTRPRRTFRWLVESTHDRLGNAMHFRYRPEDDVNVLPSSHDASRFSGRQPARLPDRILYGNRAPLGPSDRLDDADWLFEVRFGYGDDATTTRGWPIRGDVGLTARPGFEVRTRRLCRRVQMFHRFPDELGEPETLVGSLDLDVEVVDGLSILRAVQYVGHRNDGTPPAPTPPCTITYTEPSPERAFHTVPIPAFAGSTQLVDLLGEGLPGLLTLAEGGPWYSRNAGDGRFDAPMPLPDWPRGLTDPLLADFDGDGDPELAQLSGPDAGYYRLDRRTARWRPLVRFDRSLNLLGGSVQRVDVTGDGRADLVLLHADGVRVFPYRGDARFGPPFDVRLPAERLPVPRPSLDRFVADMTGDGLGDIVEAFDGSVRYWPNHGRGDFGPAIVMDDAPRLDARGCYDASRVLLVDLDQSGTADLLYLRGDGSVLYARNHGGLRFAPVEVLASGATLVSGVTPQLADFYGDGSICLTYPQVAAIGHSAMQVLRLVRAPGAHRVARVDHALGASTLVEWGHSVRHYLRDVQSGRGWDTNLPTQRAVVDAVRVTEPIDGSTSGERFEYHDGHYDRGERGFAMFAVVDHLDLDPTLGLSGDAAVTRTFFHTGEVDFGSRFAQHHYAGDLMARPPPASDVEPSPLMAGNYDDAWAALTATLVRTEVYGADASGRPRPHPYSVTCAAAHVRPAQRHTRDADGLVSHRLVLQRFDRVSHDAVYEERGIDPRETVTTSLEIDRFLVPKLSMELGQARRGTSPFRAQASHLGAARELEVRSFDTPARFEIGIEVEARTYDIHVPLEVAPVDSSLAGEVRAAVADAARYATPLDRSARTFGARELAHVRTIYWDDARGGALPFRDIGAVALIHHQEHAAYDREHVAAHLDGRVTTSEWSALGFVEDGDTFFAPSPTAHYATRGGFYRLTHTVAVDGGEAHTVADRYALVTESVIDEVGNRSHARIDYHRVAPYEITDANGTVEEVRHDALGVIRLRGRRGTTVDAMDRQVPHGFSPLASGLGPNDLDAALADPSSALGGAEVATAYDFGPASRPLRVLQIAAESFVDRGPDAGDAPRREQVRLTYVDGLGRVLQERLRVEDGLAWVADGTGAWAERGSTDRWRASGWLEYDGKRQPVAQYEPFFVDGPGFVPDVESRRHGVAPFHDLDALGRSRREVAPDGTFRQTDYGPWSRTDHDANDTARRALDYLDEHDRLPPNAPARHGARQALRVADTPITTHVDPMGRPIATVEVIEDGVELTERVDLDVRGLSITTVDRRGLEASRRVYDRLGRVIFERSMDAGEARSLFDVLGREVRVWREAQTPGADETEERGVYDRAGRLIERRFVVGTVAWLAEEYRYGERAAAPERGNHRGRLLWVRDEAGEQRFERYGAFGEVLESSRTLTETPGADPDWNGSVGLESTAHTSVKSFDALGRSVRAVLPDGVVRSTQYLRSGSARRVTARTPDGVERTVLDHAVYNARAQPTEVTLGNGVLIRSTYDARTFRLHQRTATRGGETFQDLRHHYDPVGNLVYLDDLAQRPDATRVVNGLTVTAERTYRYDARYQLRFASGRVHNALMQPDFRGDEPTSGSFRGTRRVGLNDGGAVSRYERKYCYDEAGNLLAWRHSPEGASRGAVWTHDKWVASDSNRGAPANDLNGLPVGDPGGAFNRRGELVRLPSVRRLEWSVRSQLRRTVLIERAGTDDDESYDYAADEQRVRKVRRRMLDASGRTEVIETIELDGCQLRRVTRGSSERLVRWASRVADGETPLATLYHWERDVDGIDTDTPDAARVHFTLASHIGSISLELGEDADYLAYEEYFPFGRTAFVAGDAVREVRLRTVRFVGREQDDATGFYSFQYRYYAPFIGNWVSPDPAGEIDGPNLYAYVGNNPINRVDPDGLQAIEWATHSASPHDYATFEQFIAAYEVSTGQSTTMMERDSLRTQYDEAHGFSSAPAPAATSATASPPPPTPSRSSGSAAPSDSSATSSSAPMSTSEPTAAAAPARPYSGGDSPAPVADPLGAKGEVLWSRDSSTPVAPTPPPTEPRRSRSGPPVSVAPTPPPAESTPSSSGSPMSIPPADDGSIPWSSEAGREARRLQMLRDTVVMGATAGVLPGTLPPIQPTTEAADGAPHDVLQETFSFSNPEHLARAAMVAGELIGREVVQALLEEGGERLAQAVGAWAGGPIGGVVSLALLGWTAYQLIDAVRGLIANAPELYTAIVATFTRLSEGTATVQEAGVAIAGLAAAIAAIAGGAAALRQAPEIVRAYRRGVRNAPDLLRAAVHGADDVPSGARRGQGTGSSPSTPDGPSAQSHSSDPAPASASGGGGGAPESPAGPGTGGSPDSRPASPPYDPVAWRRHLEATHGPDNVSSTTVPPANAQNARLAGTRHPGGTVYDRRGFPIFDDISAVDLNLGRQRALTGSYRGTMRAATRDLRGMINRGEISAGRFTPAQLRAIRGGRAQIPGYTWHHHQDIGRMQLVPREAHNVANHVGGWEMWPHL